MEKCATAGTRQYGHLCWAAVAHAALILGTLFPVLSYEDWTWPLWVGVTTLWFFWPLILLFHHGSTGRRFFLTTVISAALLALPIHSYCSLVAPYVFLPEGDLVELSPFGLGPYLSGFVLGWVKARSKAGADTIMLEGYGMGGGITPAAPLFTDEILQERRITIDPIADCGVTPYILGHARGYNSAAVREIRRRYGSAVIAAAHKEAAAR